MKKSEQIKLKKLADQATVYSDQLKEIQNPAFLWFSSFAKELRKLSQSDSAIDEGSFFNISTLNDQLRSIATEAGTTIKELGVKLNGSRIQIDVHINRLFPNDEKYNKDEEWLYDLPPATCIETVSEWLAAHKQDAEERESYVDEVIVDKIEEEEAAS